MKKIFVLLFILIGFTPVAQADIPSIHGMLLFGQNKHYASHLPMFHAPHDYQLIMELDMVNPPRSQTLESYELLKSQGETLFTLVPQRMDLSKIISGEIESFTANIYLGHFERGGKSLGPVTINVAKIIFSKKLMHHEAEEKQEYIMFGTEGDYYAAHIVKGAPSFDLIAKVSQAQEHQRETCTRVACEPGFIRPLPDSKLPITLPLYNVSADTIVIPESGDKLGERLGFYRSIISEIQTVLYLEEDELGHWIETSLFDLPLLDIPTEQINSWSLDWRLLRTSFPFIRDETLT